MFNRFGMFVITFFWAVGVILVVRLILFMHGSIPFLKFYQ